MPASLSGASANAIAGSGDVPLTFHPGRGTICICDFTTGFQAPEMVKVRPVVIVSPRRRSGSLATVVPISSTAPVQVEPWHYMLPPGAYPPARGPVWIKADMVVTVALARLDRIKVKDASGKRAYRTFQLGVAEMNATLAAVKAGLGLS